MYKCQKCNYQVKFATEVDKQRSKKLKKKTKDLVAALKIIVKTRPKKYRHQFKRNKKLITVYGYGWEIVKELLVCKRCYKDFKNANKQNIIRRAVPERDTGDSRKV